MVNILITFQEENGNVEVCKYLRKFAFSTEKELAKKRYNEKKRKHKINNPFWIGG